MADTQISEPASSPELPADPRHNPALEDGRPRSHGQPAVDRGQLRAQLEKVTLSDIGLATLLTRTKQSIATARDFASFLKKRSMLEDEHASGLKKLARSTHETIRRPEARQGSYAQSYEEVTRIQERMAENGLQFAISLHQMSDDLQELASTIERGRKHWKQVGTNAEKRVLEAENAMEKAKAKYDSLAEQYDRARTGDRQAGRFGLKGPKSAAQQEEDLNKKLQAADADYASKVQAAQSQRQELISLLRPQASKALQDLIHECDSGLTLQLQKFATFNEKLLLGNGLVVSPLKNQTNGAGSTPRSLRDVISSIDNEGDYNEHILSFSNKASPRIGEIKYEQHPTLRPAKQMPSQGQGLGNQRPPQQPQNESPYTPSNGPPPSSFTQRTSSGPPQIGQIPGISSFQGPPSARDGPTGYPPQQNSRPTPHQNPHVPPMSTPTPTRDQFSPPPSGYPSQYASSSPKLPQMPQQEPLSIGNVAAPSHGPNGHSAPRTPSQQHLPPTNPVFGVSLDELFRRDQSAVPMIVYQCLQAVDLFGLEVEGIYRISGSNPHIMELKQMFDHGTSIPSPSARFYPHPLSYTALTLPSSPLVSDSSSLDFRDPSSFNHDISSVAGLLKLFFRSLPSPLLTSQHYAEFISAAQIPDDILRRDSLHAIINALPDPNYATLRVLTLHLNRVQEHSAVNRMTSQNLAIVWGPTLMGSAGGGAGGDIRDAGWQAKVVETILVNTYQIFDDDD